MKLLETENTLETICTSQITDNSSHHEVIYDKEEHHTYSIILLNKNVAVGIWRNVLIVDLVGLVKCWRHICGHGGLDGGIGIDY